MEPKYAIGQQYLTRGKHKRLCQIVDIHKTYNHKGDLVKTRYVATHEFMGQIITDYDVVETSVSMGLVPLNKEHHALEDAMREMGDDRLP